MRIFAFSDTHLGVSHSDFSRVSALIDLGIGWADECWTLGDIFDPLSSLKSMEEMIALAAHHVGRWRELNPDARWRWLYGNHDMPRFKHFTGKEPVWRFVECMEKIASAHDVELEDSHLLEGDVAAVHGHLETQRGEHMKPWTLKLVHSPLNVLVPGPIGKAFVFPEKDSVLRIDRRLASLEDVQNARVRHVLFGHTHFTMFGQAYEESALGPDVMHYNTGAAIRFRPELFQPLCLQVEQGRLIGIEPAATYFQHVARLPQYAPAERPLAL